MQSNLGSPPHMRGKVHQHDARPARKGITPAYAGKSMRISEKVEIEVGSPPHMRGKVIYSVYVAGSLGITPAYAGKSMSGHSDKLTNGDHPRICGEKCGLPSHTFSLLGSPPHMRGKGIAYVFVSEKLGITPAYAGKRLKRSRSTVPPVAIVPLFPSVCNKPVVSDGSPAGRDAPLFLPAENTVLASPAYNLRSL